MGCSMLMLFGFLRCGEITVPSTTSYDPGAHLSFGDITVDNLTAPQAIQVHIKASKQTPLGRELYIRGSYRHQAMPSSSYHIIHSSKETNPRSAIPFCLWTATDKRLLCKAGERRDSSIFASPETASPKYQSNWSWDTEITNGS